MSGLVPVLISNNSPIKFLYFILPSISSACFNFKFASIGVSYNFAFSKLYFRFKVSSIWTDIGQIGSPRRRSAVVV